MKKPTLTVTSDFTDQFNAIMRGLKRDAVLVGIPDTTTEREKDENQGPITNAALLAINNFGSPANNIPARPVMQIGIKLAQDEIAEQFKKAALNALTKGESATDTYYERAGIIASNSIKKVINEQTDIDPPADSTIRNRESKGFKGTKALVVTGQMRNAITYVVNKGGV